MIDFILIIIAIVAGAFLLLGIFQHKLKWLWLCKKLGWHHVEFTEGFDGTSFVSTCVRCKNNVIQDSNGDWF